MTPGNANQKESALSPDSLLSTLLKSAESKDQSQVLSLASELQNETVLTNLDSEQEYKEPAQTLRLNKILKAVQSNKSPAAQEVIMALTKSDVFLSRTSRVELLLQATSAVRPVKPPLVEFWDAHCQSGDIYMHITVDALVNNGDSAAIKLLEKKFLDQSFTNDDKAAWMYDPVLTHRNDLLLLQMCRRLLQSNLADELKRLLVQTLFDYRPAEWFAPATVLSPPPRKEASIIALKEVLEIGKFAQSSLNLPEKDRSAVTRTIDEVQAILKRK